MPGQTFLDGTQNLAGLQVPGVYVDIILPTPFLAGVPTNLMGVVGVGSWGPTNALIPMSTPLDCSLQLGDPTDRKYDIAKYVAAACQQGGAIGFLACRVTDGNDTAAFATIGTGGTYASGTLTFTGQPTSGDTLNINGTTFTFSAVNIGPTLPVTLQTLVTLLTNSNDTNLKACSYSLSGSVITVTYKTAGTAGNVIAFTENTNNCTISGSGTLTGGAGSGGTGLTVTAKYTGTKGNRVTFNVVTGSQANSYMLIVAFPGLPPEQFDNIGGAGNAFWVNAAAALNNGTSSRGPSLFVTASAGSATGVPTLTSPTTLAGGTDGASSVTDATLMGQDTLPRKGMYAMRQSNVAAFTLCDLTTSADYAAIAAFALSETCIAVQGTVSGDSISGALATRIASGSDTPWLWLILGDWPTYVLSGQTFMINPAVAGIGVLGNLSPQQSPLNKRIGGISSTQLTQAGQTYSDTELSLINMGGIDVILGPPSSPGGYYYSFATGRNTSSNTAARGVEYTTMTNFLARTAQSKAAGSLIGALQSIQPNDDTRRKAKALFDGFSAQLANPAFGLGIGGQGMIDDFQTICDLTNNTPDTIARGYLILYWRVRYLGVVRYFVVKLEGGNNVTITHQATPPAPQQFAVAA